jgi:hypothetical protein
MEDQIERIEAPVVIDATDQQVVVAGADDVIPPYVRMFAGQEIKAVDESARAVTHLITTGAIDRMGDIVEPGGAELANFQRNPVVMANHSYDIRDVIGRATNLKVSKDGITATTVFRDTPLADAAYKLTREKLGGWSIGFRPTDSHSVKDGASAGCKSCKARWEEMTKGKGPGEYVPNSWSRHYTGWEMLEYSNVVIPANQEIVNNALARGLVTRELVPQFFNVAPELQAAVQREVPRSITPEPAKPAAPGPNAEAVEQHPVLANALKCANVRISKRFALAAVERATRDALEKIHGTR